MNDPSVPFATALNELVAIRQDLEQGRVAVDDLPQVLERAGELVERGRAVLDDGYRVVEAFEESL
jgi:exonuclease VII small subunit